MLSSVYLRFDRLTDVHGVYKVRRHTLRSGVDESFRGEEDLGDVIRDGGFPQVETIGDACMVVGGVPVPVSGHAERVANFALGMIMAAGEVIKTVTGGPIQVRPGNPNIYSTFAQTLGDLVFLFLNNGRLGSIDTEEDAPPH